MYAARALACAGAFVLVASGAGPAEADLLVPVSQARTISASAANSQGTPSSSSASASDFARFQRSVSAYSQGVGPNDYHSAGASQDSTIGTDRIAASTSVATYSSIYNPGT